MPTSKHLCDLKSCMFCKLCLPEWLSTIEAKRQMITIKKGGSLFKEGELTTGIYFIYKGVVKVHRQWGQKELIVRFAKQGDIVGHRGLGADNFYPVSCTAIDTVQACFIPIDFFMASLKINYDFLLQLMTFLADELKISESKMSTLVHMTVKGRIAHALLLLGDKFGYTSDGHVDILISKQDIASFAGTTYENVFRVLDDLTEQKVLLLEGKSITIINETALKLLMEDGKTRIATMIPG